MHRACFMKLKKKTCPLCRDASLAEEQNIGELVVQRPVPTSALLPLWDANSPYYTVARQSITPHEHGMHIIHTEPLGSNLHYKFTVQMDRCEPYCAAAVLLQRQPEHLLEFGSDFRVCKALHDNFGKKYVQFDIDMRNRIAKYRFGPNEPWNTITNLPETVYVGCAIKRETATIQTI